MMSEEDMPDSSFTHSSPRGLVNMGNTCYLNSALQALAHCPALVYYFRECRVLFDVPDMAEENENELVTAFTNLINQLGESRSDGNAAAVKPLELLKATGALLPHFEMNVQQDAQELLRGLLDGIDEALKRPLSDEELVDYRERLSKQWFKDTELEWKDEAQAAYESQLEARAKEARERGDPPPPPPAPPRPVTSPIKQLFEGQLLSAVKCLNCERVSYTRDAFLDLSLSMPSPRRNVPSPQPGFPSPLCPFKSSRARPLHRPISPRARAQKRDSGRAFETARLTPVNTSEEENGGQLPGGRQQPRKASALLTTMPQRPAGEWPPLPATHAADMPRPSQARMSFLSNLNPFGFRRGERPLGATTQPNARSSPLATRRLPPPVPSFPPSATRATFPSTSTTRS